MNKQVQCPSCKTYKVENFGFSAIKFGLACIISPFLMSYFFSINDIIKYVFTGLGVLCIINGIKTDKEYKCKACDYKFKYGNDDPTNAISNANTPRWFKRPLLEPKLIPDAAARLVKRIKIKLAGDNTCKGEKLIIYIITFRLYV